MKSCDNRQKPRVLAFADVLHSLVAAARVHAPLSALRDAGLIDDFIVTDSTLRGAPRDGSFDVVWIQRATDAWLAEILARRFAGRYLLDVDDHLLCLPAYLEPLDLPAGETLRSALANCRVLTTPSLRLARLLEARSGLALLGRSSVCPNAIPFGGWPAPTPSRPSAVLLTQGHRLALTSSRDAVLAAIAEGAARHRLPLWALGDVSPSVRSAASAAGAPLWVLRPRTWTAYHTALAGPPTLLGVAPLETRGDDATVEFVTGKSDVKMVEFGGFGHPGVYTRCPAYEDTDLSCGRLAANDIAGWTTAIDQLMDGGWRSAGDEALEVRERRELSMVAAERWWPAVKAARLEEPVRADRLFSEVERALARARDRLARVRWRLGQR